MVSDQIFDVCIVGSGPAGAFAAHHLSLAGYNVVIVEAGNNNIDTYSGDILDSDKSSISGKSNMCFSNQVGGSSNLWGGGLVELNEIDFLQRDNFCFPGWPIEYKDLAKYYKKVDEYLNIDGCETSRTTGDLEYRTVKIMDPPFNTNKLINENITLLVNTVALKLNIEGSMVESLTCVNKETLAKIKIHSQCYVVAAGGLANIQLLLHSFKSFQKNLKFNYKNIGAAISTHPKGEVGKIILNSPIDERHPLLSIDKKDGYYIRSQLGLSYQTLAHNDLLNHCLRVDSPFRDKSIRALEMLFAFVGKLPFISFKSGVLAEALFTIGLKIFKNVESYKIFGLKSNQLSVRGFFDQIANKKNCVKLSDKKSRYGVPLVTIDWSFSSSDWENVDLFLKIIAREIEGTGIGVFEYQRPKNFTGIHSHFMGGAIMGSNPDNSVVDKNLKVHGLNNLYVSGPSVFPSFGYANPFYTISALSIRLGEFIEENNLVNSGLKKPK